jgi:hypothetical protein
VSFSKFRVLIQICAGGVQPEPQCSAAAGAAANASLRGRPLSSPHIFDAIFHAGVLMLAVEVFSYSLKRTVQIPVP